ncbi:MAG: hypothetical protein ITG02_03420 [Patulibacter sp.]|nr:hypothetical protein [Patulibacter sp.]
MRKLTFLLPAAAAAALSASAVVPAIAQSPEPVTTIEASGKVIPNKAGTKKKPKSVKLDFKGSMSTSGEDGLNKPVVNKIEILLPKDGYYAGGKLPKGVKGKVTPKCSESAMMNGLPGDVCPKGSIVGKGSGNAWADTVTTKVDLTFVNGGANTIYAFTELTNPAVVQLPVAGKIKKQSGKWGYKVTFTVPEDLQVVAGTPISLRDLKAKITAKNYLFTTGCPKNKKWPYEVTTYQNTTAPANFKGTTPCK